MGIGLYGNEGVTNGSRALLISLRQLGHRVVAAKERTDPTQDIKDMELANTYIHSLGVKLQE